MSDKFDVIIKETEGEYIAISDEIAEVISKAADAATDFTSFHKELEKLLVDWPPGKIAGYIAQAAFKARVCGYVEFAEH